MNKMDGFSVRLKQGGEPVARKVTGRDAEDRRARGPGVEPEALVSQKAEEFESLCDAFVKFSQGTGFLPEPLRGEVNMFEGNFVSWRRELKAAFGKSPRIRGGSVS